MNSMDTQNWTDEELCQVYDLQHGYEEVLVDFVRHEDAAEVNSLMGVLPLLYGYEGRALRPNLFQSRDIYPETAAEGKLREDYQDYDFIYRDISDEYKTADDLREVFEGTFQYELGVAHPEILAVFGNDYPKAKEHYSREKFDRICATLPERFQRRMEKLMEKAGVSECVPAGSGDGKEAVLLMTAFLVLVMFVMAYRLNRDEGIIVDLRGRVERLEQIESGVQNDGNT